MTQTTSALFDGKVLHPEEPLLIEPNTRVQITVESAVEPEGGLEEIYEIMGRSFSSGDLYAAEQHNEHQP